MKKSELRKIIKNSIVELMTEKKVSKTKRGGDPCACSSDSDCKDAVASGCNGNKCRDSKCVADGNKTKDLNEAYCSCNYNNPNGGSGTTSVAGCTTCDDDCCTSAGYISAADRITTRPNTRGKGTKL